MNRCPECDGELWNNINENNQREERGEKLRPDYSCKNKDECGWVMWREKGKKKIIAESAITPALPKPLPKPNGQTNQEMMRLAYRKDLMCTILSTYQTTISNESIKELFRDLWLEIEK